MTGPGRPGGLGVGDRVRFGGRDQVVIGVSGPAVRLAGTGGEVVTVSVSGLLADGDFAVLGARPRPGMPAVSVLDGLPAGAVREARWWQRHIVEVLTGIPPDAEDGTGPRPEYDPAVVTLTRREQAKAAELTAAGHPVTASAIAKRRRRYQEQGLIGMIDHRAGKRMPPHGRADAAVVAAMRQAIGEAAGDSTRTAVFVLRRTRQILAGSGGEPDGGMPSRSTLYRLFSRLQDGRHTTGSASTRRSLAGRPEGPFGQVPAAAPGDLMQIDSTPLDVLVRLDSGVTGRVDLTGIIDVATRTVTAAVLRPTTKSVDASVLLARTVTPEPMRPGWPQAMRMSESALPFRRMLSIDERLENAAARPLIIPQVIVVDHGKVFISESFRASCEFLGVSLQPARKATGTDKPHIERMLGSVATMFAQYVSGYTGRSPEYRGRGTEEKAVWSLPELQDLLDQWLVTWQNRPHDGLRDPLCPGRAFSPNEKYAALTETAGYVPLALSPDDYIELLPATWRAVNAYGIKISRRIYDGKELNPLRMQHSGVTARKGLHEVHYDPYDISRVWVRDHQNGGWITVFWTQLHRVAAPFGELAWDHARKLMPAATEAELADAVQDLLTRAGQGPGDKNEPAPSGKRDRRVAGRTRAVRPAMPAGPEPEPGGEPAAEEPGSQEAIVPMPIFDPFREAEKWR
ncbi:MAG TPA: Mu transposase C-terminal domain-containing protein [Gemmataceae bacterium]